MKQISITSSSPIVLLFSVRLPPGLHRLRLRVHRPPGQRVRGLPRPAVACPPGLALRPPRPQLGPRISPMLRPTNGAGTARQKIFKSHFPIPQHSFLINNRTRRSLATYDQRFSVIIICQTMMKKMPNLKDEISRIRLEDFGKRIMILCILGNVISLSTIFKTTRKKRAVFDIDALNILGSFLRPHLPYIPHACVPTYLCIHVSFLSLQEAL